MAKPLKWKTLEKAAGWLSEETGETWTKEKIIDFSIKQCSPDDHQRSAYLRAVLPVPKITRVSVSDPYSFERQDIFDYVKRSYVSIDGQKKETTALFRENLIELQTNGSTKVDYTFSNKESAELYAKQCREKHEKEIARRDPLFLLSEYGPNVFDFPYVVHAGVPCPVFIDVEMLGIRQTALKRLLADSLKTHVTCKDKFSEFKQLLRSAQKINKLQHMTNDCETEATDSPGKTCEDAFSKDECLLFDPLNKKQIMSLFSFVPEERWKELFNRAYRNGLKSARRDDKRPYHYNPAKVANWLFREGKYKMDNLARILAKNFPLRSAEHRESFLDLRGLLDKDS